MCVFELKHNKANADANENNIEKSDLSVLITLFTLTVALQCVVYLSSVHLIQI